MLVYLLVNLANGKRYIGQTKHTLTERKAQHLWAAINNPRQPIAYAIRKYGADQFYFRKLRTCSTKAELNYWEEYYIKYYGTAIVSNGYNVTLPSKPHRKQLIYELRNKLILDRYYRIQREQPERIWLQ